MTLPRPISNATLRGAAYLNYTVTAWCHACHHHADLDLKALARRLGPDHGALHKDLAPKLKCEKCGGKNIGLIVGGYKREMNEDARRPEWPEEPRYDKNALCPGLRPGQRAFRSAVE